MDCSQYVEHRNSWYSTYIYIKMIWLMLYLMLYLMWYVTWKLNVIVWCPIPKEIGNPKWLKESIRIRIRIRSLRDIGRFMEAVDWWDNHENHKKYTKRSHYLLTSWYSIPFISVGCTAAISVGYRSHWDHHITRPVSTKNQERCVLELYRWSSIPSHCYNHPLYSSRILTPLDH